MQRTLQWWIFFSFLVAVLLALSACTAAATYTAIPTPLPTGTAQTTATIALSINAIPTSSHPPTATLTPWITWTRHPSLTPGPPKTPQFVETLVSIVWAESFYPIAMIPNFEGIWSPTANELVGIDSDDDIWIGNMVFAAAPDFIPQIYDSEHAGKVFYQMKWSPDGQNILYGIYLGEDGWDVGIDYDIEPWIMDRTGENARLLLGEGFSFRGLNFPLWMDEQTVVATSYAGGGHLGIDQIDISSNRIMVSDLLSVIQWGQPRNDLLPVTSDVPPITAKVVTRELQTQTGEEGRFSRSFPLNEILPGTFADSYFLDWLPYGNSALVRVDGPSKNRLRRRMFVWNVDTDLVANFIPGGMNARVSQDREYVAFTTIGPSNFYTASLENEIALDIVPENQDVYIQIMRLTNREILFSLPNMTRENSKNVWPEDFGTASFSLDSKYLAFLTIGPMVTDDQGWPIQVNSPDPNISYINILDLETERLVFSESGVNPYYLELAWSPISEYLIYSDASDNWYLVYLPEQIVWPITQNNKFLREPAWSFDGQFFSFAIQHNKFDILNDFSTVIFELDQTIP